MLIQYAERTLPGGAQARPRAPVVVHQPAGCRLFRCDRYATLLLCCVHCTHWRTSARVKVFKGSTFSSNRLTCDTVSAGAFFPQTPLHMPQKKMGQHTRQHMVMPPRIFAQFIVGHTSLGFRLFKTLFNGPPHTTEPD